MSKRGGLTMLSTVQRPDLPPLGHLVQLPGADGVQRWYRVLRATGERVMIAKLSDAEEHELLEGVITMMIYRGLADLWTAVAWWAGLSLGRRAAYRVHGLLPERMVAWTTTR